MLSEPRAIFFQTELEWPPFEPFAIERDVIRGLYNKMFEADGYEYPNLDLQSDTPTLSRSDATGQSFCRFSEHCISIEERKTSITLEVFIEIVETVLGGLKRQRVPPFFLQRCKIHCLAQPHYSDNSIQLLAAKLANVYERIEPFERPPSFFGVRFRFTPAVLVSEQEEKNGSGTSNSEGAEHSEAGEEAEREEGARIEESFVTVRFETYAKDVSQVWMEVAATYPQETPLTVTDIRPVGDNIRKTYAFLVEKGKRFLDQFDKPNSSSEATDNVA